MMSARAQRFWYWFGAAMVPAALLAGFAVHDASHPGTQAELLTGRAPEDIFAFGLAGTLALLAVPVLAWVGLLGQATRCSRTRTQRTLCLSQALLVCSVFACFSAKDPGDEPRMFPGRSEAGARTTLFETAATACSWSDINRKNAEQLVPEFFNYAEMVVYGRVVARQIDSNGVETAQVAVLRSFKGTSSALQLVGHSGHCGYRFRLGEKRIFFINGLTVGSAGAKHVSSWMWTALDGLDRTSAIAIAPKPVPKMSRVRVRNASKTPFFNVFVGGRSYGNIGPNCTTSYQRSEAAYRKSSVSLIAESQERRLGVVDHLGESPLGEGRFTYVLTYESGQLGIRAERDEK